MKPASRFLLAMAVVISLCWLVPVVLIGLSALGPREAATAWPKAWWPAPWSLDTLQFFLGFTGVWQAVLNSVIVALLTMVCRCCWAHRRAMRWRASTSGARTCTACWW